MTANKKKSRIHAEPTWWYLLVYAPRRSNVSRQKIHEVLRKGLGTDFKEPASAYCLIMPIHEIAWKFYDTFKQIYPSAKMFKGQEAQRFGRRQKQ